MSDHLPVDQIEVPEPPPQRPLSAAQVREEQRRLKEESERERQRFQTTKDSVHETWERLVRNRDGSPIDRTLRHAALNLLEDTQLARLGEEKQAADRKRAEERTRTSEAQLHALAENLPGGAAFIIDRERRYQLATGEALFTVGMKPEDFLGRTVEEALGQQMAASYEPHLRRAFAGEAFSHEHESHGRIYISRGVPLRDASGEVESVLAVSYDITERKRAEEALEKSLRETQDARAEAEAAGRAKDHFLAVLSHELRTPLTPVLMSVDFLMLRTDLPPEVIEGLEMIQRNVTLESQFIGELLDITKISRGKLELSCEPMDLHRAIQLAAEVARPDIESRAQRLTIALDAPAHELVGDFKRLQQVFWNLLKNASKFTPERGEIAICARNEPTVSGESARILVEVTDAGMGFNAEAGGKIFDAFTQADESITHKFGGLGLGLAISKATIDAHGGTIRGTSPGPGQGATFTVCLPLAGPPGACRVS